MFAKILLIATSCVFLSVFDGVRVQRTSWVGGILETCVNPSICIANNDTISERQSKKCRCTGYEQYLSNAVVSLLAG